MRIEPAHVNQIQAARDGRFVEIDGDAGGVADDLRRIDPSLRVRFAENGNPPFWAIYNESEDKRTTYLVLTVKAYQTNSGVWSGLDQRVVKRIEQIGHPEYDFGAELEATNRQVKQDNRAAFAEKMGPLAELAAHAIRKDLGARYKGRAFLPRDIGPERL